MNRPYENVNTYWQYCNQCQPQQQVWNQQYQFSSPGGQPTSGSVFNCTYPQSNSPVQKNGGATFVRHQNTYPGQRLMNISGSQGPDQRKATHLNFGIQDACNSTPQVPPAQLRPKAQWIQNGNFKLPPEFSNAHTVVVKLPRSGAYPNSETVNCNYCNSNPRSGTETPQFSFPQPNASGQSHLSFSQQHDQQLQFAFSQHHARQQHFSFSQQSATQPQFSLSEDKAQSNNLSINKNFVHGSQRFCNLNAYNFNALDLERAGSPDVGGSVSALSKWEQDLRFNASPSMTSRMNSNRKTLMEPILDNIAKEKQNYHVSRRDKFEALKQYRAANQGLFGNGNHATRESDNQRLCWDQGREDAGNIHSEVQDQSSHVSILVAADTRASQIPSRYSLKSPKRMKSAGTSQVSIQYQSISVETSEQDLRAASVPTAVYLQPSQFTQPGGVSSDVETFATQNSDLQESIFISNEPSQTSLVTSNCGVGPALDPQEESGSTGEYEPSETFNDFQTSDQESDHMVLIEEVMSSKSSVRIGATRTKSSSHIHLNEGTEETAEFGTKHFSDSSLYNNKNRYGIGSKSRRRFRSRSPGPPMPQRRLNRKRERMHKTANFGKRCSSSEKLKCRDGLKIVQNEQDYTVFTCVRFQTSCGPSRQACQSSCAWQSEPCQCTPSGCNTGCAGCISDISSAICTTGCCAPTFYLKPICCQPTCSGQPCCNISCGCPSSCCYIQPCGIPPPRAPCCDPCPPPLPPRPCTMILPPPPTPPPNRATCNEPPPCSPSPCGPRCRSCSPCSGFQDAYSTIASSRTCRSCSPCCSTCPPANRPCKPDCTLPCPPSYLPCCSRTCPKPPCCDPCPCPSPPPPRCCGPSCPSPRCCSPPCCPPPRCCSPPCCPPPKCCSPPCCPPRRCCSPPCCPPSRCCSPPCCPSPPPFCSPCCPTTQLCSPCCPPKPCCSPSGCATGSCSSSPCCSPNRCCSPCSPGVSSCSHLCLPFPSSRSCSTKPCCTSSSYQCCSSPSCSLPCSFPQYCMKPCCPSSCCKQECCPTFKAPKICCPLPPTCPPCPPSPPSMPCCIPRPPNRPCCPSTSYPSPPCSPCPEMKCPTAGPPKCMPRPRPPKPCCRPCSPCGEPCCRGPPNRCCLPACSSQNCCQPCCSPGSCRPCCIPKRLPPCCPPCCTPNCYQPCCPQKCCPPCPPPPLCCPPFCMPSRSSTGLRSYSPNTPCCTPFPCDPSCCCYPTMQSTRGDGTRSRNPAPVAFGSSAIKKATLPFRDNQSSSKPKSMPCMPCCCDPCCDPCCQPCCDRCSSPCAPPVPPPCLPSRRKFGNGSGQPPKKKRKRRLGYGGALGFPVIHTVVKHVPCSCYEPGEMCCRCPCYDTCC